MRPTRTTRCSRRSCSPSSANVRSSEVPSRRTRKGRESSRRRRRASSESSDLRLRRRPRSRATSRPCCVMLRGARRNAQGRRGSSRSCRCSVSSSSGSRSFGSRLRSRRAAPSATSPPRRSRRGRRRPRRAASSTRTTSTRRGQEEAGSITGSRRRKASGPGTRSRRRTSLPARSTTMASASPARALTMRCMSAKLATGVPSIDSTRPLRKSLVEAIGSPRVLSDVSPGAGAASTRAGAPHRLGAGGTRPEPGPTAPPDPARSA